MNLPKFLAYSAWISFISNAYWILGTQKLTENQAVAVGVPFILASIGWIVHLVKGIIDSWDND